VNTPRIASDVIISGDHAFIADRGDGLHVVDVTNSVDPHIVGSVDLQADAMKITISGNHAYVADDENSLRVIDITAPENPQVVGHVVSQGRIYGVSISGDYIYIASGSSGLHILPIQCDISTPVYLSSFTLHPTAGCITVSWQISSNSDPATFRLVASNRTAEWVVAHQSDRSRSFIAEDNSEQVRLGGRITYRLMMNTGSGQWRMLEQSSVNLETPSLTTRLVPPYPNPFNPNIQINYECNKSGPVHLGIYDLAGRRVIDLFDGWLHAGSHEAHWSGLNEAGQKVATGQYLVRLRTPDGFDVRKVVLAK